jgi:hypothetical protein
VAAVVIAAEAWRSAGETLVEDLEAELAIARQVAEDKAEFEHQQTARRVKPLWRLPTSVEQQAARQAARRPRPGDFPGLLGHQQGGLLGAQQGEHQGGAA